jgi:secreted trypsin-like serine protease
MLKIMKKFLLIRVIILLIINIEGDASNYACDKNIVPCGCGQTSVGINARIVNGENAIPHSWPMMVSLTENRRLPTHICGGTILSESYILTAAHCVDMFPNDLSFGNLTITAGILNLSQPDRISRQVDKISIHPLWEQFRFQPQYDIAILHLAEPLNLEKNSSITRTCLPPRLNTLEEMMQYPLNGTSLVVIGWGLLNTSGSEPDTLQQVTVNSIHHFDKICTNIIYDPSIQFCAGLYEGGKGEK